MNVNEVTAKASEYGANRVQETSREPRPSGREADAAKSLAESLRLEKEVLDGAADEAGRALKALGLELKFHIDERTDTLQVEIYDPASERVVRKLPPDDLLKLAASVKDMARGLLDKTY